MRRRALAALVAVAATAALAITLGGRGAAPPREPVERHRGVCFVAGGPVGEAELAELAALGVDWISQTPFGWVARHDRPSIRLVTDGHVYWGERDEGLRATTRLARTQGIRTLLKPHLWLRDRSDGKWEGSIAMTSEADWRRWFAEYERFIVHYARLAESEGIEALALGTELEGTTHREADWRRVIARVRQVYRGQLTYCANWSGEYRRVRFWDALDFIGVQAYFPLAPGADPALETLMAGWAPVRDSLAALHRRTGKRIVFTEIGYRSASRAAVEPWLWRTADPVDHVEQARCYEAAFRALWHEPWFGGTYWWKWFPHWPERRSAADASFTPQGKPATQVMSKWYRGEAKRS